MLLKIFLNLHLNGIEFFAYSRTAWWMHTIGSDQDQQL